MKRWLLGTILVLLIAATVIAITFPASLAYRWWGAEAPALKLQGINGTLWTGEAGRFSVNGVELGKLSWTISPWRVLRGEVESRLMIDGPGLQLTGHVHRLADGGVRVSRLSGEAQGGWLGPALAIPVLEPTGILKIDDAMLRLDANGLPRDVDAELVWETAGVRGQVMARFGTIRVAARGSDGRIAATIADAGDGELEVNGKWDLDQTTYHSEIRLRSRATEGPVVEALKWIGAAEPDGGRLLIIDGHLLIPER